MAISFDHARCVAVVLYVKASQGSSATGPSAASSSGRPCGDAMVFFGEEELAKSMTNHVLQRFDPQQAGTASNPD